MSVREYLAEIDPDFLFADGFDEAVIGYAQRCGQPALVVYDLERCVEILVRTSNMTQDEAEEYLAFNTEGAWVGERTPLFLHRVE